MKFLKLILLFFFVFSSYGLTIKKGDLHLPDIYVWGEDKSYLEGLYDKEGMLHPHLRKFHFLEPLSLKYPAKLDLFNLYPAESFFRISGRAGEYGKYNLRAIGGKFVQDKLFYSYDLGGSREIIEDRDFSLIRGSLNFGKNYKKLNNPVLWRGSISGLSSDFHFRRNLLRMETEFFWNPLILTVQPSFSFRNIEIARKRGTEYALNLKSELPIFFRHRLIGTAHFRGLNIANKKHWQKINISYFNTMFRDFSFLLEAGTLFHNRIDFIFNCVIGGKFMNIGYRIAVRQQYYMPDIYLLYGRYKFLRFRQDQTFHFEDRKEITLKLIKNLNKLGVVNLDFRLRRIEDAIILIDSHEGLVPFNKAGAVDVFESKAEFEKGFLRLNYIYRISDKPLPYFYDEFNFIVSPTFKISEEKSINIESVLNYIRPHQIWLNEVGSIKENINSYWEWNLSLRYNISRWVNVEIGGDNLLSQAVNLRGGYVRDVPRFHINLSVGFSK